MELAATNPEGFLAAFLFAMLRPGGAFLVAPVFSAIGLPLQLRMLAAAAVALTVMQVAPPSPPPLLSIAGVLAAAGEIVIGLALGFVLQLALAGAMLAGEQIASTAGLGFAALSDPQSGAQSPIVGQVLMLFASLVFIAADGHLALVEALVRSHAALPPGTWPSAAQLGGVAQFGAHVFVSGLMIALPVTLALFAVNMSLGVLTRAAPQMNMFAVGLPISVVAGMGALAIAFPTIIDQLAAVTATGVERLRGLARG